jgi:hypothetical protein
MELYLHPIRVHGMVTDNRNEVTYISKDYKDAAHSVLERILAGVAQSV